MVASEPSEMSEDEEDEILVQILMEEMAADGPAIPWDEANEE